jgi:hypothetical protein
MAAILRRGGGAGRVSRRCKPRVFAGLFTVNADDYPACARRSKS